MMQTGPQLRYPALMGQEGPLQLEMSGRGWVFFVDSRGGLNPVKAPGHIIEKLHCTQEKLWSRASKNP